MRICNLLIAFLILCCCIPAFSQTNNVTLETVHGGLMKYYLSLPVSWNKSYKFPVVISLESAEKKFKENATAFSVARQKDSFIIVTPIIVTNGRGGRKDPGVYPYSIDTWNKIDTMSDCTFDMEQLYLVIKDVQYTYNAQDKVFLTGFEAGTHLLWAFTFKHPEMLKAVAPVAGNYIGRCVDNSSFSYDASRKMLPIKSFFGQFDSLMGPQGANYYQYNNARQMAITHGFRNIGEKVLPGKGHVPIPVEVLTYFKTF